MIDTTELFGESNMELHALFCMYSVLVFCFFESALHSHPDVAQVGFKPQLHFNQSKVIVGNILLLKPVKKDLTLLTPSICKMQLVRLFVWLELGFELAFSLYSRVIETMQSTCTGKLKIGL